MPSFPQIALCFPSLALRSQPLQNCKLEIAKLQITDYKGDKRAVHNLGAGSPTHPPEVRKWWNKTKHRLLDACYVDERGKAFR